ncbi:RNA helicase [Plakobranchus ocellatus]|uniref:RNA helicase n=1 Tax=Plakobranchus ocellatus TaxID=259542 RepID=A0AAV3Z227_9GAST|nr:RNA helicase [Plakobranchus ocellatus]
MLRGQTSSTKYSPTWEKTSANEVKEQLGLEASLRWLLVAWFEPTTGSGGHFRLDPILRNPPRHIRFDIRFEKSSDSARSTQKLLDMHERTAHPSTTPKTVTVTTKVKTENVKSPVVSACGTSDEWTYFVQHWSDYKQATRLTGEDINFQLLERYDEALHKDLTRSFSNLTLYDEPTLKRM